MNTEQIIELLGGRKEVMDDTGLSKGRLSQWVTADRITPSWERYFRAKRPDLDWGAYDARHISRVVHDANAPIQRVT